MREAAGRAAGLPGAKPRTGSPRACGPRYPDPSHSPRFRRACFALKNTRPNAQTGTPARLQQQCRACLQSGDLALPLIASPDASPETVGLLKSWKLPAGTTLAVEVGTVDNDALLIERCAKADAILLNWAKVSRAAIEACPNLKIISFL